MGLLLAALTSLWIVRRIMPMSSFWPAMKFQSKVLLVLLLIAYLLTGFAVRNSHNADAALPIGSLILTVTIRRKFLPADEQFKPPSFALAPAPPRSPPAF